MRTASVHSIVTRGLSALATTIPAALVSQPPLIYTRADGGPPRLAVAESIAVKHDGTVVYVTNGPPSFDTTHAAWSTQNRVGPSLTPR